MRPEHAEIVPGERVCGVELGRSAVRLERGGEVAAEEMHLRHRLKVEPAVLARVEAEPVFPQRFGVVAALTEREAETVMRERAAFDDARPHLVERRESAALGAGPHPL